MQNIREINIIVRLRALFSSVVGVSAIAMLALVSNVVSAQEVPEQVAPPAPIADIPEIAPTPEVATLSCEAFAANIQSCTAFSCKEVVQEGGNEVEKTIHGLQGDKCHYTETMPGDLVTECLYSEGARNLLMAKHQAMMAGDEGAFTPADSTTLEGLKNTECKTRDNQLETAQSEEQPVAVEEGQERALPKGSSKSSGPTLTALTWKGSLMYPVSEIRQLEDAVSLYSSIEDAGLSKGEIDELIGGLLGTREVIPSEQIIEEEEEIVYETPDFYLHSILYLSPENWTVWVNRNRINAQDFVPEELPGLFIEEVSEDRVHLVWRTPDLNQAVPDWEDRLEKIGVDHYASSDNAVFVGGDIQTVNFVLRPNQSFSTSELKVTEGSFYPDPVPELIVRRNTVESDSEKEEAKESDKSAKKEEEAEGEQEELTSPTIEGLNELIEMQKRHEELGAGVGAIKSLEALKSLESLRLLIQK